LGAALFAFALMGLTFGVEGISGGHSIGYVLTIGSIILFPVLFAYQWRKGQNALFNLSFIRSPEILIALLNNLLVGLALILLVAGVPIIINLRTIFLQGNGLLTGALNAGLVLCALTAPLLLAVIVGENNYKRVGAAIPTAFGFALAAGGFLLAALTWQYESASAIIVLPLVLVGIGLGLTFGPLGLIVIEGAPEGERGMASSLVIMARLLGMTIGTPLAGTLTLKLANDRIVEQTRSFSSDYRYIAQSMILPVELTRALSQVLFVGVVACLLGFTLFYAPRALAAIRQLQVSKLPGVLIGWLLLAILGIAVYSVALSDGRNPQVYSPVARQLPVNTVYYAATNAQTIFLSQSTSALDAVLSIFQRLQNPVVNVPRPGMTEAELVRLNLSQTPPTQPAQPDLLTDGVKLLFGVENWTDANFKAFCPEPAPQEPARWRDCFSNALLGWLGPHLGVGAWDSPAQDRSTPEYRYMFAIQTTNFNNAYVFALKLAQSLNEKPPADLGPNRRLLTLNAGKPNERLVAITDDYMYIGTPGAVREVLAFQPTTPRLATQPEFTAMLDRVGGTTAFVTGYARSQRFFDDLRGTLNNLLGNALIDPLLQTLSKLAVFRPAEGNNQPVQLGVALKIEDKLVAIKAVSDFPAELPNFKPGQVPLTTLDVIPNRSPLWAATRFNLEDVVRDIKLQDILGLVADLSGAQDLRNLLNNGLVNFGANVVDGQLRGVLNQTNGDLLFLQMPGANPQAAGDLIFVLPLKAAPDARQQATRSLRDLDGTLGLIANFSDLDHRAQTYPGSSARVTTLNGKIFGGSTINGVQYAITENNLLVISLADRGAAFAQMLAGLEDKEPNAVAAELSTNLQDYFLYTYVDDNNAANGSKIWLGAKLMRKTLVIDGRLVTK
jgi:MFS family permease